GARGGGGRRGDHDRQLEHDLAPVSDAVAPGFDRSIVKLHELSHEGEPDAEASLSIERGIDAREELEYLGQLRGWDADAVVLDRYAEEIVRRGDGQLDVSPGRRVLRRVPEEVTQHLDEPIAIRQQHDRLVRQGRSQSVSL